MQRKRGIALLASGLLLATVSLAGVFAATNDTATTGDLSIESGTASIVDLQLGGNFAAGTGINCQPGQTGAPTYTDDLTSPFFTMTGAGPTNAAGNEIRYVCIYNNGSVDATMTADFINGTDTETGCSAGEEGAGDTTCGTAGSTAGELANDVTVTLVVLDGDTCTGAATGPAVSHDMNNTATPLSIKNFGTPDNVLDAGDAACVQVQVDYDDGVSNGTELFNQTDKAKIQIRFNGAV